MTRILILVTSLDRGGIETMIMNYYRKIDRRRWQFDFLVNRAEEGAYEKEIKALGGRIYRMGAMYPWRYVSYRREFLEFLAAHPEYQAIHSHLEERSYWPLRLAQKAGVPVRICHAHNVYPFRVASPKGYFRQWFRYGLRGRGIATLRLACSGHAGEWLYGKGSRYQIVTNAIDLDGLSFAASARAAVRRELGIGEDVRVAGFVGRLVPQKNPEYALRVFAGLKNREAWRLVLVGKGELRSALAAKARELGVEKLVVFAGEVPDTAKYCAAFDVLLMPSRYEGLGMVAVEAGAAGLQVIASTEVPAEANVAKNVTFLTLGDIVAWRRAMTEAGAARRSRVVKKTQSIEAYDIDNAVKKLEKIYEDFTH